MHEDFEEKMNGTNMRARFSESHPKFEMQDKYVLAPEQLTPEESGYVSEHLVNCAYCRRMQSYLRNAPEVMLEVWSAKDPRVPPIPQA